jgi:hypothetical protein
LIEEEKAWRVEAIHRLTLLFAEIVKLIHQGKRGEDIVGNLFLALQAAREGTLKGISQVVKRDPSSLSQLTAAMLLNDEKGVFTAFLGVLPESQELSQRAWMALREGGLVYLADVVLSGDEGLRKKGINQKLRKQVRDFLAEIRFPAGRFTDEALKILARGAELQNNDHTLPDIAHVISKVRSEFQEAGSEGVTSSL